MEKINMSEVTKNVVLAYMVGEEIEIDYPTEVTVMDYESGTIDQGEQGKMPWAKLIVVGTEEYKALASIGYEANAKRITVKLADYQGELLNDLVGKTISTELAEIVFVEKRGNRGVQIEGMAFKMPLSSVKVVQ